ncbi:MAG: DUF885 domain-containing protein [Sphingomonadales bacterium]|nr:DUF885 domain-containing protein [Sphingomonadales bacterium]MBD3774454.1 DUF885 domain-containing protein [Paracoccaceae bacterium]
MTISSETTALPTDPHTFEISRRQAMAGLGASTAIGLVSGCAPMAPLATAPAPASATQLLDDIAWRLLAHEPERATSLGVDTGDHALLRYRLEDQTAAGQQAYADTLRADLQLVRSQDRVGVDPATVTSLEVVESAYSVALDGFALPYGDVAVGSWRNAPYVVIQNVGTYLDMPRFMDSTQPMRDGADVDAYCERMDALAGVLDGELARMQSARAMGVVPPDFLLAKAITAMEQSISTAAATYTAPLAKAPDGRADAAQRLVTGMVESKILPALDRQLAELKAEAAQATGDPGMYQRPHGEEWYHWALRASTTTTLSPDEVHREGLAQLEQLHARMDPILRKIGYTSGSVGERMTALSEDPRYKFPEGDPGRKEIMDFLQGRIAWIKSQMPRAFRTLVPGNLEVRRLPLAEEPGAPGAYGGAGSKDGSIPGRMWINLRTTDLHRKYDLADLAYHETIPGHVWEGEYSNTLPLIRSILAFNAFSEGWALYAEQLADELGAYDDFEVGRLGYLQSLAFRACRMVVDTGLHSKQWTRQQAVDFFVQRNGSKPQEVASEVDRYCSWPGQACGYKVGHSEIVRQRGIAQQQLGAKYDLRDFDDAVVLGGNAPLDVMAKNVARYIARASA